MAQVTYALKQNLPFYGTPATVIALPMIMVFGILMGVLFCCRGEI